MSTWVIVLVVVAGLIVVAGLVVGIVGPSWSRRHQDRIDAARTAALGPPEPVRVNVGPEKVLLGGYTRDRLAPRTSERSPWAEFRQRPGTPGTPPPLGSGSPGRHRLRPERPADVVAPGLIPLPMEDPDLSSGVSVGVSDPGPRSAGPEPVAVESAGSFSAVSSSVSDSSGSSASSSVSSE